MYILITAATEMELAPIRLKIKEAGISGKLQIDFRVCGIGQVSTAYWLTRFLSIPKYDLCFNIGIAGSFTDRLRLADVTAVYADCFADLGIEHSDGVHSLFDEGLVSKEQSPFTGGQLICPYLDSISLPSGVSVSQAVTVNTASGTKASIDAIAHRYKPDIESMEGAAFFYVCLSEKVRFIQIRAISNKVEPRDKSKWNIPLALDNLSEAVYWILTNNFI